MSGTASEAWGEVIREVRRVGHLRQPSFTNAATMQAVKAISGSWNNLACTLPADGPELLGWMKRFESAYSTCSARRQQHALVPPSENPAIVGAVQNIAAKGIVEHAPESFNGFTSIASMAGAKTPRRNPLRRKPSRQQLDVWRADHQAGCEHDYDKWGGCLLCGVQRPVDAEEVSP